MELKELKARSEPCGTFPSLIEIAETTKSPTAAYDLANKKHGEDYAKACRYLAIIKRDFGKKTFNEIVKEIKQKSSESLAFFSLLPFIQTANRLSFLRNYSKKIKEDCFKLSISDKPYIDIVELCIKNILELFPPIQQVVIQKLGEPYYLNEAKGLLSSFPNVDSYSIEKTFLVLKAYVETIQEMNNISKGHSVLGDSIIM